MKSINGLIMPIRLTGIKIEKMETKTKQVWTEFTTETGLKAKYQIVGDDLRFDVRIKILTPMPKGYYHSAVNEAGAYYDEQILPNLNKEICVK
jgi:hypothetical protein